MIHDELLEIIDTIQNTINANKVYARKGFDALRAVVELCSRNTFTSDNKEKWEKAHGHSIFQKCYAEFGCQLLIDPRDILEAIEKELK